MRCLERRPQICVALAVALCLYVILLWPFYMTNHGTIFAKFAKHLNSFFKSAPEDYPGQFEAPSTESENRMVGSLIILNLACCN